MNLALILSNCILRDDILITSQWWSNFWVWTCEWKCIYKIFFRSYTKNCINVHLKKNNFFILNWWPKSENRSHQLLDVTYSFRKFQVTVKFYNWRGLIDIGKVRLVPSSLYLYVKVVFNTYEYESQYLNWIGFSHRGGNLDSAATTKTAWSEATTKTAWSVASTKTSWSVVVTITSWSEVVTTRLKDYWGTYLDLNNSKLCYSAS